jgi:hypothetical protein
MFGVWGRESSKKEGGCCVNKADMKTVAAYPRPLKADATPSPPAEPPPVGRDLPDGDDFWIRRDGDWRIVTGEMSHNCHGVFAGWNGMNPVSGSLSNLPRGNWFRASPSDARNFGQTRICKQLEQRLREQHARIAELEAEKQRLETQLAAAKVHWKRCDEECTMRGVRIVAVEARAVSAERERDEARREVERAKAALKSIVDAVKHEKIINSLERDILRTAKAAL